MDQTENTHFESAGKCHLEQLQGYHLQAQELELHSLPNFLADPPSIAF